MISVSKLLTVVQNNCPPNCPFPVVFVDPVTGDSKDIAKARVFQHPKHGLRVELVAEPEK